MSAPEASLSLARHALDFPNKSVRDRATTLLKGRDELSFVPQLLSALQTRVRKQDGFEINQENQLLWRQRLFFETQNAKQIATFDRLFQFPETMPVQSAFNSQAAQQVLRGSENQLRAFNTKVDDTNERITQLIAETAEADSTTPFPIGSTPEEWWKWWDDRLESYSSGSKSVVSKYEWSYTVVTPPPPRCECLAAGTPIWTETGSVAVEQVKIGDLVLSKNPQTGELKFAPVLATTTRSPEPLFRMKINKETVRATGGHPFWVSGKGWTKARSLKPGMGLHTAQGVAIIDSIEEELQPAETFNLIVDECHSYFVGTMLILSHDNSAREPVTNRVPGLREDGILVSQIESKAP